MSPVTELCEADTQWRNRIVGHGEERPDQLLANPLNWRMHPKEQKAALNGVLSQIGWVQEVIVNRNTNRLIDGHLRVLLAKERNEPTVPVIYVDLSEHEEALILATLDPLAAMATADRERLDALLRQVDTSDAAIQAMLEELAEQNGLLAGSANDEEEQTDEETGDGRGPVYSVETIVEAAFRYFRQTGFPYRRLPVHVCMQQINKLATTDPDKLLNSDMAYHVADTYHPHRFHAAAEGMKSPFEGFQDDKRLRRSLRLCLEYGGTVPDGMWSTLQVVSSVQACANFRPGFACFLYRRFCEQGYTVLDTSTGYGGRLVGFMASGIAGRYIGIDPNKPTHEGNLRMAADLGFADKVELYNLPAEDVPHELVADRCDFAFTSPPYFSKEHYSDDDTQSWVRYKTGEAWRRGFLVPMLALQYAALKPGRFAIVNIADVTLKKQKYPLVQWTLDAARQVGFKYVKTEEFTLHHRFGAGHDDEIAIEPVLVFQKS